MIWPSTFDPVIRAGRPFPDWVTDQLNQVSSTEPTRYESLLCDLVLSDFGRQILAETDADVALCNAAITWSDLDLWKTAISKAKGPSEAARRTAPRALTAFGLENVSEV